MSMRFTPPAALWVASLALAAANGTLFVASDNHLYAVAPER